MSDSTTTPAGLDHLRQVIHERTLDVLGTYHSQRWHGRTTRLVDTSPATLAAELATAIADGVTLQLAGDPGWPDNPVVPARPDELVLTPKQVDRYGSYLWYQPAAQIAGLHHEATVSPGWPFLWVSKRLRDTGALGKKIGGRPTPAVREDVASVRVRRDGSVTIELTDGTLREFGALDVDEHLPETIVRNTEVDSHEGHYLTPEQLRAKLAERDAATADTTDRDNADDPDDRTPKANTLLGPDGRRYALRLDRLQISDISWHLHWLRQLYTNVTDHFAAAYPGWTPQELGAVFYESNVMGLDGGLTNFVGRREVTELWISSTYEFLVVYGKRRPRFTHGSVTYMNTLLSPGALKSPASLAEVEDAAPTQNEDFDDEDAEDSSPAPEVSGGDGAAIMSLDGFFDLDEEEQTDRVMEFLGLFSPNPEVREQSARAARERTGNATDDDGSDQ